MQDKPAPKLSTQALSTLSKQKLTPREVFEGLPPEKREEYITLLEAKRARGEELPHLYGMPWYTWAREFFESDAKMNFLCAANQISKSSTQIRKCIHWATETSLWPGLWADTPDQFWYLYPTADVATVEYHTKWKLFLPRGKMGKDPKYGWVPEFEKGKIKAIHFNSGIHLYFKTYAQDTSHLQTGTVYALFTDEEVPINHYDELIFRISAVDGYFHMVFTATLGQDFWRTVMEPEPNEEEKLPEARKWTVSLYDSQYYEDGEPSKWTDERIQIIKNRCGTAKEVLKRVYGKFVMDLEGLKYPQFDIKRHMKKAHPLPKDWMVWSAVDPGTGGDAHPAGILFMAVAPDFRKGRVFLGWRGENIGNTTAGDVLNKHEEMKRTEKIITIEQIYDPGCKDFMTLAERSGLPFSKANKDHTVGTEIVNVLFKNDMITIYETPELQKLASELSSLRKATLKRNAKDNLADPLRYLCVAIPWDWSGIGAEIPIGAKQVEAIDESKMTPGERQALDMKRQIEARREEMVNENETEELRIEDEFRDANEMYGN